MSETMVSEAGVSAPDSSVGASVDTSSDTTSDSLTSDSLTSDSLAGDSLAGDSLAGDSLAADGVALGEDGVVRFGDDFFNEFADGTGAENDGDINQTTQNTNQPRDTGTGQSPEIYTAEELKSIPPFQWQKDRLPPNMTAGEAYDLVSPFVQSVVQQNALFRQAFGQMQAAQAQTQAAQAQNLNSNPANAQGQSATQPQNINNDVPHSMSDAEIDEAAVNLALTQLGVKEDDFDPYNPKHQLALYRAADKVRSDNMREIADYQRKQQIQRDSVELGQFVGQLQRQPDYLAFDKWLGEQLAREGRSPNAISEYMMRTGDIRATTQIVGAYYQKFRQTPKPVQSVSQRQVQNPPAVESSGGNSYNSRRVYSFKNFGDLSDDERADALVQMGLCEIQA